MKNILHIIIVMIFLLTACSQTTDVKINGKDVSIKLNEKYQVEENSEGFIVKKDGRKVSRGTMIPTPIKEFISEVIEDDSTDIISQTNTEISWVSDGVYRKAVKYDDNNVIVIYDCDDVKDLRGISFG